MDKLIDKIWGTGNRMVSFIPEKIRYGLIVASLVALNLLFIFQPIVAFSHSGYAALLLFGLAALLAFSLWQLPDKRELNLTLLYTCLAFALCLLANAYFHKAASRALTGVIFLFVLPAIWLVLTIEKNRELLLNAAAWAEVISLYCLLLISLFAAPLYTANYCSILLNPNGLAQVLIPMLPACLYLWEKRASYFFLISAGISLSLILLTRSRTGFICSITIIVFWLLYQILIRNSYKSILKLILACGLAFVLTTLSLNHLSKMILTLEINAKGSAVRYVDAAPVCFEKPEETTSGYRLDKIFDRLDKSLSSESDDVSSGRFAIWQQVGKKLNWQGRPERGRFSVTYGNKTRLTNNPHNVFLYFGFFAGIPTMVCLVGFFLAYIAVVYKRTIHGLLSRKLDAEDLFLLCLGASFFIVANLSGTYAITSSAHSALFWYLVPLAKKYEGGRGLSKKT